MINETPKTDETNCNMRVASPQLLEFLVAWQEWANTPDCESNEVFRRKLGLCGCLSNWCYAGKSEAKGLELHFHLARELKQLFAKQGYHLCYPFGVSNFVNRREGGSQHRDPQRLQWVNDAITQSLNFVGREQ